MVNLQNRKMPSLGTAWAYIGLASFFAMLSCIQPLTGLILMPLAIAFAATGVLSIPRLSYFKVLLLSLAMGLLPAVCIYFFTGTLGLAVIAFSFAPAVAFLALTIRLHQSRSAGIRWIVVILTLFYAGSLLLIVWEWKGGLSIPIFKALYNDGKEWFIGYLSPMLEQYPQLFEQMGISQEVLADFFKITLSIAPGFCFILIWSMAWLATACLRLLFKGYVYGANRFANWPVTMTKPAAWLFLPAFLVSALPLSDHHWWVMSIALNLYYIFLPGFFIVGCRVIKERILAARGCGCFTFTLIGLIFTMPTVAIMVLAMTGAFRTIAPAPPKSVQFPIDPQNPQNPDDQGGSSQ